MLAHGFGKPYGLGQLYRVFSLFLFFLPFLGDFAIFRGILDILEEKVFLWPFGGFLMVLWPFGGILGLLEAF